MPNINFVKSRLILSVLHSAIRGNFEIYFVYIS